MYLALDTLIHGKVNTGNDCGSAADSPTCYNGYGPINYLYEVGTSAAIQAVLQDTIGKISPIISGAITTFFNIPATINALIYTAAQLLPTIAIGPVTVGGGILAGLYYNGVTPDGSFQAGSSGIPGILDYITNSIAGAVSAVAAVPVAASKSAAAVKTLEATTTDATSNTATDTATTDTTAATDTATTDAPAVTPKSRVRSTGSSKATTTEVASSVASVKPADSTVAPTTGTEATTPATTSDAPSATPKADSSSSSAPAPKKQENKRPKHAARSGSGSDS